MKIETGYPFYGQKVGILVFSTESPRVSGDAGNAQTFNYSVRYEIVNGKFSDLIEGGEQIKNNLLNAARNLKKLGIRAIVGDCGLMSLYQKEVAENIGIPVAVSSLCQIPFIWELVGRQGTIGILTGHSELLSESHLKNSGWRKDISIEVQGLQAEEHFSEIVINGGLCLEIDKMRKDIISSVEKLIKRTPDIRAIVFECSNIATFSKDIYEEFGVPVFDIISTANMLEYSVNPPNYI